MNIYFCNNLKSFLMKNGMTKTELGRRLGVSEVSVSRWASGVRNPRTEMVDKMCEVFNCSYNDLMGANKTDLKLDQEAYGEVLLLLENLNTDGITEVINFIGNLNDRFLK